MICRKCNQEAVIPAYRLRKSVYVCTPCENRRLRQYDGGSPRKGYYTDYYSRSGNKEKRQARQLLIMAVRKGEIIPQPCRDCNAKAEAHHPDYNKPLSVVWLCKPHHRAEHLKATGKEGK